MSTTSKIFKTVAIVSTALLSLLGACAIDDPIDYTTDGYTAVPTNPSDNGAGGNKTGDEGGSVDTNDTNNNPGTEETTDLTNLNTSFICLRLTSKRIESFFFIFIFNQKL